MQNTNYFQYWQFCFICHSNWGFMSNNEMLSYVFLQKKQKKQSKLSFYIVKKYILSFNDLFIKCSSSVVCTLFLNNCQFIQYVNNWPFSSIEWNSDLTNKSIDWSPEVFVWKCWSALWFSSHFVSGQHWAFSNLNISSREIRKELSFTNNGPIRIPDKGYIDQSERGLLTLLSKSLEVTNCHVS